MSGLTFEHSMDNHSETCGQFKNMGSLLPLVIGIVIAQYGNPY